MPLTRDFKETIRDRALVLSDPDSFFQPKDPATIDSRSY
jgi:hypothetical protein